MKRLVYVVQEVSLARTLDAVMTVVRRAARELSAADGCSFILRDNGKCFYADEDAIAPLWKGQRFPMQACVSGWAMLNRKPVAIEDIYNDSRVPVDAYRPTFVKSMLMVPIRTQDPIGAIGVYWAQRHAPTQDEIDILAALADTVSVAIENANLNAALEQRVHDLEDANRIKDDFLMTISHELRTPLNSVLGWSEILHSALTVPKEYAVGFETIARNAESLNRLIDDLLDTSRITSGSLSFEKQAVDPVDIINAAVASVSMAADARRITIGVETKNVVGMVLGDAVRLQQVLWNLLTNAIKFSPPGGSIMVTLERDSGSAKITVKDHGQGMDPDLIPFMFDRFRQADGTTSRKYDGLGLGLALTKYLVEAHGGKIDASSEGPGRGSTFTVQLPLAAIALPRSTQSAGSQVEGSHKKEGALAGWRVVVVDDMDDVRLLLSFLLRGQGAVVEEASDASRVLDIIESFQPDLLLSDLCMPGEDGYSLVSRLRSSPRDQIARLPAIAITAYADPKSQAQARASGFDAVISKPVFPKKLIQTIQEICGSRISATSPILRSQSGTMESSQGV